MEIENQDFGLEWIAPKPKSHLVSLHIITPWTQEQVDDMCKEDIGGWQLAELVCKYLTIELEKRNASEVATTAEIHGLRAE